MGLCLSFSSAAQAPLSTSRSIDYPGMLESLEKLIQFDQTKYSKKNDLLVKNGKIISDLREVTSLDLDPDFLNSLILHSTASYVKLSSSDKCRLYDSLINDLLRSAEGKVKNIFVTYLNKNKERESSLLSKKDFLNKVVNSDCPESSKLIDQFKVKNLDQTILTTNFSPPSGKDQCHNSYLNWLNNPKAPYFCKIHEFMKEARLGQGDAKDLGQRKTISQILEKKISPAIRDYLENLCENFDNEEIFCEEFLNTSFWTKIANGTESNIFAEDICYGLLKTNSLSTAQIKQCLSKIKKENDLCLYPGGKNQGLRPGPQCDSLAMALNYSSLRADYKDCPIASDQQAVTNLGRIFLHMSKEEIKKNSGPCSTISSGTAFEFNKRFNNDENWKLEACYDDPLAEKEICYKTFFGEYGSNPESFSSVVAEILRKTKGADKTLKCEMLDSQEYNPLLLQFKSGCYIIYERSKCFIGQCKHKILYNDRLISNIRLNKSLTMDYFPSSIIEEKFSQHYLLTRDFRKNGRSLNSLININNFFKNSKEGIIHGVGCAEDLLPSFFKTRSFNQCSPLPFIIDGIIRENDKTVFVTRTAADTLQAPRLVSWSLIFSAVKSYQRIHPLRIWTLYGLD